MRQICRPGRGASGRAGGGICSSDHAGGGTSGAIGLWLVVQLFVFGRVWFVRFLVHGPQRSVECFLKFVVGVDFTVGFRVAVVDNGFVDIVYENGPLVIGGFVGDARPAHRRRAKHGRRTNQLDCIRHRPETGVADRGVADRAIAGSVRGQFRAYDHQYTCRSRQCVEHAGSPAGGKCAGTDTHCPAGSPTAGSRSGRCAWDVVTKRLNACFDIADRAGESEEQRPNAAVADCSWVDEYDIEPHRWNFHPGRTGRRIVANRFGGYTNRDGDTAGWSGAA